MVKGEEADRLLARPDVAVSEAHGYLYRPGEVLVAEEDVERVEQRLRRAGAEPEDREEGVARYRVADDQDVPELIEELRRTEDARPPRVGPNHLVVGEPFYRGGPGDDAQPTDEAFERAASEHGKVVVGVLDTGLFEHEWLSGRVDVVDPAADAEELDDDGDAALDPQAGHGTFVAGLVLTQAPQARVRLHQVLDSHGVGDELAVVRGIRALAGCDVINLSLGGYAHGDVAPVALATALERLDPRTAVVAAAGNHASSRPFWPAAFKRVVAVAALEEDGSALGGRAWFSNHGYWVDAAAPGVKRVSTFVEWKGRKEPQHDFTPGRHKPEVRFAGWARWSGTSFAAPLVSGAIAAEVAASGCSPAEAAWRIAADPALARVAGIGAVARLPNP